MELVHRYMDNDACSVFSSLNGCRELMNHLVWMCLNISECDELKYRVNRQVEAQTAFIMDGFGPVEGGLRLLERITGKDTYGGTFGITNEILKKLVGLTPQRVGNALLSPACKSTSEPVTCAIRLLTGTPDYD